MDCWCISTLAHKVTKDRVISHLKTLSFDDLIAHGDHTIEFLEWCRVRGATRDLRPYKLGKMPFSRHIFSHAVSAFDDSLKLEIPDSATKEQLVTLSTAVTKMRVNCLWAATVLPGWQEFYGVKPEYPKDLMYLIAQFTGSFIPLDFNEWRPINGRRSFISDMHEYLAYLRSNKG